MRSAFARHEADQSGFVAAYEFGARDERGDLADIAAWTPGDPLARLWRGAVFALGAEDLFAPRLDRPLWAHPDVLAWLLITQDKYGTADRNRMIAVLKHLRWTFKIHNERRGYQSPARS